MFYIDVADSDKAYRASVNEDVLYAHIVDNEESYNGLSTEDKLLKAIYELYLQDNSIISYIHIDRGICPNITSKDCLSWADSRTADSIYKEEKLRVTLEEYLNLPISRVGVNTLDKFWIRTEGTTLFFSTKTLCFYIGDFSSKYKSRVKRTEISKKVQIAVMMHESLIKDFIQSW